MHTGIACGWSRPLAMLAVVSLGTGVAAAEAGATLPEGRVYERVSSPDKRLADVQAGLLSADDGNTVAFASAGAGDDAHGAQAAVYTLARRTPTGWQLQSADAASVGGVDDDQGANNASNLLAFSSDFTRALYNAPVPLDPTSTERNGYDLFRVSVATGLGNLLSRSDVPPTPGVTNTFLLVGANADLSRVYFQSRSRALKVGAPPSAIYEWRADDGLRVASVLPDGTQVNGSAVRAADFPGGAAGPGDLVRPYGGAHSVSEDGSRLFFTVSSPDGSASNGPLYMREGSSTTPISASQRAGSVGTVQPASFVSATRGGDSVFFLSTFQLTDTAPAGSNLYRYRVSTGALEVISGGVEGWMPPFVSDDGSHVYFTSMEQLAPGGQQWGMNSYVWTEDDGVEFVAEISDALRPSRVSRDGRYALYESFDALNGATNNWHQAVYRYDAQTKQIDCASCRPDGTPSQGDATLDRSMVFMLPDPGVATRSRNVSDSGQVFFSSNDQIVPEDRNTVFDSYVYTGGQPHLLSSGRSSHDSVVADNSDDGSSVFFTTRDALVPDDDDGGTTDLYNARVGGGGFPVSPPTPAPCVGDECRREPTGAPSLPRPNSADLVGPGNVTPRSEPARIAPRIVSIGKLSSAEGRKLLRGSTARLSVRVRGGGTLRVTVNGRGRGVPKVLTRANVLVRKVNATTVKVPLRLSPSVRRHLRGSRSVPVRFEVRLSGVKNPARKATTLKGAAR